MNAKINIYANTFSDFLSSQKETNEDRIFSYAFKLDNYEISNHLSQLSEHFNEVFFFEDPSNQYSIVALDTATKLSSDLSKNFIEVEQNFNKLHKQIITNWDSLNLKNPPLICCAVKFDGNQSSVDWKHFPAISFYIPQIILFNFKNDTYFIYNCTTTKDNGRSEKLKLERILNMVLNGIHPSSNLKSSNTNKLKKYGEEEGSIWKSKIDRAKEIILNSEAEKLVVSRTINFSLNEMINWDDVFNHLNKQFPECQLFFYKIGSSSFFGASPERFMKAKNGKIELEAVAGSAPRGQQILDDKNFENRLLESKKNKKEHRFVSDFIFEILNKHTEDITISDEIRIRKLNNIQHLITKISAKLKSRNDIFKLIDMLFPTPAVCGVPKNKAMEVIRKLESHDRGLYSGIIGWMDLSGNCELAVAIRSALVNDKNITVYAGAGIVEDSDPNEEFYETKLKLEPILSLFRNDEKDK
jgi:menaquinone-specific isochorismate synthase